MPNDEDEPDLTAEFDNSLERYDGINASVDDNNEDSMDVEPTERDQTMVQ
jgi:hypothetical protein